jgi:hypothetical protein
MSEREKREGKADEAKPEKPALTEAEELAEVDEAIRVVRGGADRNRIARNIAAQRAVDQLRKVGVRGIDRRILMQEVERREEEEAAAPPEPPAIDINALRESAKQIIESDDVLALFDQTIGQRIAGESMTVQALYLILTSRLFIKTMHAAVKGPSSGGKSELLETVMGFMPPEDVIEFTMSSEKALLYKPSDCRNKILWMGEALTSKTNEIQDYLLRELMSKGKLIYDVVQKDRNGQLKATKTVINGPVTFVVTTTHTKLHPENETRMLSLEIDDSQKQTALVMDKVALVEGLNLESAQIDYEPWRNYQRLLAAGERRVIVPFARELVKLIIERISTKAVRLRRDTGQLLRAIKAHALLHRDSRKPNQRGEIVATIAEDYAIVRAVLGNVFAEAAEVRVNKQITETVKAVEKLTAKSRDPEEGARTRDIVKALKLDRSVVTRRLNKAADAGLIINVETKPGRPGRWRATGEESSKESLLPTPEEVAARVQAREAKRAKQNDDGDAADPSKIRTQMQQKDLKP